MPYLGLLSTALVTKSVMRGFTLHLWLSWAELLVCLASLVISCAVISSVAMRIGPNWRLVLPFWTKRLINSTIVMAVRSAILRLRSPHSLPRPESTNRTTRHGSGWARYWAVVFAAGCYRLAGVR